MEGNKNMKKIIKAGICVAVAAVIATGCGNKNQNTESSSAAVEETVSATTETETKSEEELHDEESVTLGDYKNLTSSIILLTPYPCDNLSSFDVYLPNLDISTSHSIGFSIIMTI